MGARRPAYTLATYAVPASLRGFPVKIDQTLHWLPNGDGWLGILPCGFMIHITKVGLSDQPKRYAVRFGNCSLPETFGTEEDAKTGGVILARRVLVNCMLALPQGLFRTA